MSKDKAPGQPSGSPTDRRRHADRRSRPSSPFSRWSLFGSRQYARRREDREVHRFVDRYSPRVALVGLLIILLSVADAMLTLKLLELGVAREANPIMNYFLGHGPRTFLTVKFVLTAVCVLTFLVFKNFKYWRGRMTVKWLLVFVLVLYVGLIFYELTLFWRLRQTRETTAGLLWHGRHVIVEVRDRLADGIVDA